MTERKEQGVWLKEFYKNWPNPDISRRMSASEYFHEYVLHPDEMVDMPGYIKEIIERDLDEVTRARLKKSHASYPPHDFYESPE